MARNHLEAFKRHKAEKKTRRRDPDVKVFDKRAMGNPKSVVEGVEEIRGPLDSHNERSLVVRNLRGDTLAYLRDRRQIDEHQYIAGRHWQEVYEAACGTVPAMDTTKEPVDGGGIATDGLTDRRKRATKELLAADILLNAEGSYIMRHVAGSGITLAQAAEARGICTKTMGQKFRKCLDILAVEFGYADRKILTIPVNTL